MTPNGILNLSLCWPGKERSARNRRVGLLKWVADRPWAFGKLQLCVTEAWVACRSCNEKEAGKIAAIQTQRQGQNGLNYFCVEK